MRLRSAILVFAAASVAAAVPALAATPEAGTVSKDAPVVKWEGTATGYGVVPLNLLLGSAGQGPAPCEAPTCDSFALTVADKYDLNVVAAQRGADNFTELHVVKPDGEVIVVQSADGEPARLKVKQAAPGDYTIEVLTNETAAQSGAYDASATLAVPAAAPAAPAAAEPAVAAEPAPAPAPAPAVTLGVRTKSVSAKKRALRLALTSSGPVTGVKLALKKGKRVVGKGSLARLDGKGRATIKLKRRLRPGTYVLAIMAADGARTVGLSTRLKIRK